jgi:hypothetical protein
VALWLLNWQYTTRQLAPMMRMVYF